MVVALIAARPPGARRPLRLGLPVRVLVHAVNRQRALTRLRNLGLRAVYLRGNAEPPTPDEITAVLHHPDGLLWRDGPAGRQRALAPDTGAAAHPALPVGGVPGRGDERPAPAA